MNTLKQTKEELSKIESAHKKFFGNANIMKAYQEYTEFSDMQKLSIIKGVANFDHMFTSHVRSCFMQFTTNIMEVDNMLTIVKRLAFNQNLKSSEIKNLPINDPRIYAAIIVDFYYIICGVSFLNTNVFKFYYNE